MTLRLSLLWLLVLSVLPAAVSPFPRTVTDTLGRRVTVTAPPRRIVSLAPSSTEGLFAVAAGDRVVGVTHYDNYPPQVRTVTRVGGYVAKSFSVEKILSLEPDLVFSYGEIQRPVIAALEQVGIPVVALEPRSFEEAFAALAMVGELTGQAPQAARVVAEMQRRVAWVRERVAAVPPARRLKVFFEVYNEPLITAGPATFIGQMITMAAGLNIFAELTESYPQVSAEEVLRRNPDVILGPDSHGVALRPEQISRRPGWQQMAAVRNRRLHLLDEDLVSRPGPRLALALEAVARALYPDLFP